MNFIRSLISCLCCLGFQGEEWACSTCPKSPWHWAGLEPLYPQTLGSQELQRRPLVQVEMGRGANRLPQDPSLIFLPLTHFHRETEGNETEGGSSPPLGPATQLMALRGARQLSHKDPFVSLPHTPTRPTT